MEDKWRFMCIVRGYHIYKDVWEPYLSKDLTMKYQRNNPHDKSAVVVIPADAKSKKIVGHLLREISKEYCLFILNVGMIMGIFKDMNNKEKALGKGPLRSTVPRRSPPGVPAPSHFQHQ